MPSVMRWIVKGLISLGWVVLLIGCASVPPYVGSGPNPQITRGASIPPLDVLGSVLALPGKLILWNRKFANHSISEETEYKLVRYLNYRKSEAFKDTQFRLNQYCPIKDMAALFKNKHVGWPYRLLLGLPTTLIYDVLLPGRIFPWGDYFNPFTNTIHLYSDDIAIALHEAGHAYDSANYPYKGFYALLRTVPFMDLYQEWWATDEAIRYLRDTQEHEEEIRAYKVLYPAYGTYLGSYLTVPFGSAIGALGGHVMGRARAANLEAYYQEMEQVLDTPERTIRQIAREKDKGNISLEVKKEGSFTDEMQGPFLSGKST